MKRTLCFIPFYRWQYALQSLQFPLKYLSGLNFFAKRLMVQSMQVAVEEDAGKRQGNGGTACLLYYFCQLGLSR